MREKQQDMRYKRTQRNLRSALIELLNEKRIDAISVRELSERADINRATFYLHYDSPYALLVSLENQLFDTIMASYKSNARNDPEAFFSTVYQCIYDNFELSKALLHQSASNDFWDKLGNELQECYINNFVRWKNDPPYQPDELEYYCAFVKDGYLSIVKRWIRNDMQESTDYMVALSLRFLSHIKIDAMF